MRRLSLLRHLLCLRRCDLVPKTGGPGEMESEMLEVTLVDRQPTSELSCQIVSAPELDGLILRVPQL
jgi:2Fe-2S ferredoxin